MLNKNTWGVKKCEAKKNQQLKALKRWPRVTKPIMVGKTPCNILCVFEVNVSNKFLARYKLLGPN